MSSEDSTHNRRRFLQGTAAAATAGLAGCSSMLEGDDSEGSNQDNGGSTADEPTAEYSQISDYDGSVDATRSDSYSFTAGVERSLDGETTVLDAEVEDAYIIRDNENYEDDILEEAGLYNEVLDKLEQGENSEYTLPTEQLLPGNNLLHIELSVNDEEHGHSETYTFEEELQVTTNPEEALEQTWIEDRNIFTQLREQHREEEFEEIIEYGQGTEEDTTWGDIAEQIPDYVAENSSIELEEEPFVDRISIIAGSWMTLAQDIKGAGPSGDADKLAYTLEKYEDVEAGELNNNKHSTVLAYHREEDKMYHVETGAAGRTTFPPETASFPSNNPEYSPLYNLEGEMMDAGIGTLLRIGQVENYEDIENLEISETFVETSMEHIKDGTDMQTLVNTMQRAGVSASLSPELNFEINGDVNNPEIRADST